MITKAIKRKNKYITFQMFIVKLLIGEWNRVDIGGDFEYQYDVNFFDINNPNKEVPPADESQVTEFVTRLYTKCLGRNPEAEGLKNWTNQLVNRKIDGATVGAGFVFSEEYQSKGVSRQEFVQMLYRVHGQRS